MNEKITRSERVVIKLSIVGLALMTILSAFLAFTISESDLMEIVVIMVLNGMIAACFLSILVDLI